MCILQGLGKRPVSRRRNQQSSENHTSWTSFSANCPRTHSTYGSDFCETHHTSQSSGQQLPKLQPRREETPLTHKFQVFSKSTFHRFPRSHTSPHLPPPPPISQLADWFPHDHQKQGGGGGGGGGGSGATSTPLMVLAESQKPFLPHNPWVYSYRS